jgi:phosphatidylglycerophosphate synthase
MTAAGGAAATTWVRPERKLGAALASLESAQKPGDGVPAYTRWINRRLARGVVAVAYVWGLSPNAVTVLSAIVSAAGLALLVVLGPSPLVGVGVAALLAAGYVLDSADGQLARLSGRGSPAGEWLDHVVDAIRSPGIHLAVAVSVVIHRPASPEWLAIVGVLFALLVTGQFMSQILAEQLRKARGESAPAARGGALRSWALLPSDMGTTCWIFVLWGFPIVFGVAYTALLALLLLHTAASMRRRFRELAA